MRVEPMNFDAKKFGYASTLINAETTPKFTPSDYFVDAQPNIGISKDKNAPPIICIRWFYGVVKEGKIILDYRAQDCFLCINLDNYESDSKEWDKIIALSYVKFGNYYLNKMKDLGIESTLPIFHQSNLDTLRESLIQSLKKQIG